MKQMLFLLLGLSVFSLISTVNARGGAFVVESMHEVTDELTICDMASAEICGNLSATIHTWHSIVYRFALFIPPLHPIPFDKIFQLFEEILENIFGRIGTGCFLLAWKIWTSIKGLRRGRPPDYRKID